jgi:hypothetical protein
MGKRGFPEDSIMNSHFYPLREGRLADLHGHGLQFLSAAPDWGIVPIPEASWIPRQLYN